MLRKKQIKQKKKQKKIELKEIKLRPVTEIHDYSFKIKNAQKFLAKGDKVKFTIRFKGRELQHSSLGNDLMEKIKQDMQSIDGQNKRGYEANRKSRVRTKV